MRIAVDHGHGDDDKRADKRADEREHAVAGERERDGRHRFGRSAGRSRLRRCRTHKRKNKRHNSGPYAVARHGRRRERGLDDAQDADDHGEREAPRGGRWQVGLDVSAVCNLAGAGTRQATEGNQSVEPWDAAAAPRSGTLLHGEARRAAAWVRHANAHLIVDSAVGLSNKLRVLPQCERAHAAAEAPAVSDAGWCEEAQQAEGVVSGSARTERARTQRMAPMEAEPGASDLVASSAVDAFESCGSLNCLPKMAVVSAAPHQHLVRACAEPARSL